MGVKDRPKTALLLASSGWYLYTYLLATAQSLTQDGFEVIVVCPPDDFVSKFEARGLRVRTVKHLTQRGMNPVRESLALLELIRLYREERPDVVFHYTIKCVVYGTIAAKISGVAKIENAEVKILKRLTKRTAPPSVTEIGEKAQDEDYLGRFREIILDPLNLLIHRDKRAGLVNSGYVYLHNALKVPVSGPYAYYGKEFSQILVLNRGVHEPLEEFVFQQVLEVLPEDPTMLELGAYWAHYSMWLKSVKPKARLIMVESDPVSLDSAKHNFKVNGLGDGEFLCEIVREGDFEVDSYLDSQQVSKLSILHADIQGFEIEMLEGAARSLDAKVIDYVFVSTHSQELHSRVVSMIQSYGYQVEVSSDFDSHTTSIDGFVFASSPTAVSVFKNFAPMGRTEIQEAEPKTLVEYLSRTLNS